MNIRACTHSLAIAFCVGAAFCSDAARAQTWSAGTAFPTPLVRGAGVWFAQNGRFYVLGGRSSDAVGSDLMSPREYDPSTATWSVKTAVFNDNQVNNMVAGALDDAGTPVIFTVGGSAAGAATSTSAVRRYDPTTDTLTVLTTDPWPGTTGTTLPGGSAVYGNKLYILGGFTINVAMTDAIWEFDPSAPAGSKWTQKTATLGVQLGYVPCATIGSMIYTGGGSSWTAGTLADSTSSFVYDPVADVISGTTSIPRATGETRGVAQNGLLWVLGGGRVAPNPSNEVDVYSPVTNTWSIGPAFGTARRNFATDIDPATGRIYVVGGYAPSTAIATMQIFSGNAIQSYCGQGDVYLGSVCPCGVQGVMGHGCENSGMTGGALLEATGTPAPDTLVLSASGVLASTSCVFVQGSASHPSGYVFGTGVRCAAGTLKRLYVHSSVAGAVLAPAGSDSSVTARSASLGDPIAPGSTRYYTLYYHDAAGGPGGCLGANFNASNGLSIHY